MYSALHGLNRLDPSNTGHASFKTGTNVYISLIRIENAFVLADALEQHGYERLARELSAFARGVIRENKRAYRVGEGYEPTKPTRGITSPSWERWRTLNRKIDDAIGAIQEEENKGHLDVHWYWTYGRGSPVLYPVKILKTMSEKRVRVEILSGENKGLDLIVDMDGLTKVPRRAMIHRVRFARGAKGFVKQ